MKKIIVNNIKNPFDVKDEEFISEAKTRVRRAGMNSRDFTFKIFKRSIDARHRDNILCVCSVLAETSSNISIPEERFSKYGISIGANDDISFEIGNTRL